MNIILRQPPYLHSVITIPSKTSTTQRYSGNVVFLEHSTFKQSNSSIALAEILAYFFSVMLYIQLRPIQLLQYQRTHDYRLPEITAINDKNFIVSILFKNSHLNYSLLFYLF